eukprot:177308_1
MKLGRVCVARTAVRPKEVVVVALVRVLLRAEEEHVFQEMRISEFLSRIGQRPDMDIQAGCRFVRVFLRHQAGLDSILESDHAIVSILVGFRFDDFRILARSRGAFALGALAARTVHTGSSAPDRLSLSDNSQCSAVKCLLTRRRD